MSQYNEVPGVSVGREGETPHGVWYEIPCERLGDGDTLHHQLCVDVPLDVIHHYVALPPHLKGGMMVVHLVIYNHFYTKSKALIN